MPLKIPFEKTPLERNAAAWRLVLLFLYALIILTPPVLATALGAVGHAGDRLARIGTNLALTGFAMVCLQFVISARIRWVERPFGLDALLRFHRRSGVWAGVFLIAHPLLLIAGESKPDLLYSLDAPWFIWFGRIAVLVLIVQILASIFRAAIRLGFEAWRRLHHLAAWSILILGFTHGWVAGSAFAALPLRIYWIALGFVAAGAAVWHKWWRPAELREHRYRVASVKAETASVRTITLEPEEGGQAPDFLPGQFHFLTPVETIAAVPAEEHPFTISSCPTKRRRISSTIKDSGDFTSRIADVRPGDHFTVHGPFGRFSHLLHPPEKRLLFIAGGIGITPLMSMLRHMRNERRADLSVTLLYANKSKEGIVFESELAEIADGDCPGLKVVHVLSEPGDGWGGETGHIDLELILRHFGPDDFAGGGVYLCAPPKMIAEISEGLAGIGIPKNRIHHEAFEL